jgi:very-short-patch-repair endonuclease
MFPAFTPPLVLPTSRRCKRPPPNLPLKGGGEDSVKRDSPALKGRLGWGVFVEPGSGPAMSIDNARRLRKDATDAERKLWSALRHKQIEGFKFRRQVPIGEFVADFACLSQRLIIEADGGQHDAEREKDAARTAWLNARGYRVIRFWNNDVLDNLEGVVQTILIALHDHPPP